MPSYDAKSLPADVLEFWDIVASGDSVLFRSTLCQTVLWYYDFVTVL